MIHQTQALAAISVAQEWDATKRVISAVPGTPLDELVKTMCLTKNEIVSGGQPVNEYAPDAACIVGLSSNWNAQDRGEEILHSNTLDSLVADISTSVTSHLKFAKTVVKPLILELAKAVTDDIAAMTINPYKTIDVVQYDLPAPVKEAAFEESVMAHENVVFDNSLKHMSLPVLAAQELMDLLVSKVSYSDEIQQWLAVKGAEWIQNVYNSVFTDEPSAADFSVLRNGEEGLHICTAVYLLCNALYDNPPEGTAVPLAKYNNDLVEYRNQSALKIIGSIKEYDSFSKTGLIVKNSFMGKAVVVASNYKKWLEAGGTEALLFAGLLSSKPAKYQHEFEERKTELLTEWESHVWLLTVSENNKKFLKIKQIVKDRTLQLIQENFVECYSTLRPDGVVDANIPEYAQSKVLLDNYLLALNDKDLNNIWDVCLHAVCKCIFFYTDSDKILTGIEDAMRVNPDLPVSEAALLSTIVYITDYVCDQMIISDLGA